MYSNLQLKVRVNVLLLLTFSSASSLVPSARADQKTALTPSFWKCLAQVRLCSLVSRSALFTNSMFTLCSDTSFTYDSWQHTHEKKGGSFVWLCSHMVTTGGQEPSGYDSTSEERQNKKWWIKIRFKAEKNYCYHILALLASTVSPIINEQLYVGMAGLKIKLH